MKFSERPKQSKTEMPAYEKRFGPLSPGVRRSVPDYAERSAAAMQAGQPDPVLQQFKVQKLRPVPPLVGYPDP